MAKMPCSSLKNVKAPVCLLLILFGMGSWVSLNGLWVELPVLVENLPEGWKLPSYMFALVQMANIGPLAYTLANCLCPQQVREKIVIFVVVSVGTVTTFMLPFFWKSTSIVVGELHSTGLLPLMFFLSLVDCTSSVLFIPFMNTFKSDYMLFYLTGEGFSCLIPSLVAIGQGVGQMECVNKSYVKEGTDMTLFRTERHYLAPRFSVEIFFFSLFAIMLLCQLSFCLLSYLPYCKQEQARKTGCKKNKRHEPTEGEDNDSKIVLASFVDDKSGTTDGKSEVTVQFKGTQNLPKRQFLFCLFLTAIINALTNGILPSVQSYACMPYGSSVYHSSAILVNIINPVACLIAFFYTVTSVPWIGGLTALGTVMSLYILVLADLSPNPPLVDTDLGVGLVLTDYGLVYIILVYSKVTIATLFRKEGRKALLWFGAVSQIGSAVGAGVIFIVVNVFKVFVQKFPCT